jgi:hypothetical protein
MAAPFRSDGVADVWTLIAGSVDRLVEVAGELEAAGGRDSLHWRPSVPDANSVLVLGHHTLENLEDNILYTIAGQQRSSDRDREREFGVSDATTDRLVERWANARARAREALAALPEGVLAESRVHPRRGELSVLTILVVVARHASEHLAHAELTRDLYLASGGSNG